MRTSPWLGSIQGVGVTEVSVFIAAPGPQLEPRDIDLWLRAMLHKLRTWRPWDAAT